MQISKCHEQVSQSIIEVSLGGVWDWASFEAPWDFLGWPDEHARQLLRSHTFLDNLFNLSPPDNDKTFNGNTVE